MPRTQATMPLYLLLLPVAAACSSLCWSAATVGESCAAPAIVPPPQLSWIHRDADRVATRACPWQINMTLSFVGVLRPGHTREPFSGRRPTRAVLFCDRCVVGSDPLAPVLARRTARAVGHPEQARADELALGWVRLRSRRRHATIAGRRGFGRVSGGPARSRAWQ